MTVERIKFVNKTRPKQKFKKKVNAPEKPNSRAKIDAEIAELNARITIECKNNEPTNIKYFTDLPISKATLRALKIGSFKVLTPVQLRVLPKALAGNDLQVQAPTGSGKTLAFVIPMLELLFRSKWDRTLGLAAIILTPTRELATQIFEVIKSVGRFHEFSSACVIGGKDLKFEQTRLLKINILTATPGRILHHLEGSSQIDSTDMQLLVLDEADQMLDMGFFETLEHILEQIPKDTQRWLFSATLNFNIQRLSLISLNDPVQITVEAQIQSITESKFTPNKLFEFYMVSPLENQINLLFSVLRMKSQCRTIVFVNSCKQVRFLFEAFRKLKPGPAVFELLGRQSQQKRLEIVRNFSDKLRAACLICTDIAARGLDFQNIDWVVQLNCPFNIETYIHRVGRTARYKNSGSSLLFLLPSEVKMLQELETVSILPQQFKVYDNRIIDIKAKLGSLLAANEEIKYLAERAMHSYIRSIALSPKKEIFDAKSISASIEAYAQSIGLICCPVSVKKLLDNLEEGTPCVKLSKLQKLKEKINQKKSKKLEIASGGEVEAAVEDEELLKPSEDPLHLKNIKYTLTPEEKKKLESKIKNQEIRLRKDGTAKIKGFSWLTAKHNTGHIVFDDSSESEKETTAEPVSFQEVDQAYSERIKELGDRLRKIDATDKAEQKTLRQQKRHEIKKKAKGSHAYDEYPLDAKRQKIDIENLEKMSLAVLAN